MSEAPKQFNYPPEPILYARFLDIKNVPNISIPENEEIPALLESAEYRLHSFEEARKAFLYIFDFEKIKQCLADEPSEENFMYLKQVRRLGLIIRAMYVFFDISHKSPELLHKFISDLGKFNDSYWLSLSQTSNLINIPDLDDEILSITISSEENFKKSIESNIVQILHLLDLQKLSVTDFHSLRKNIRLCADILQVCAAEHYGSSLHWLCASLLEISRKLGEQHDKLVVAQITHATETPTEVDINPEIKIELKSLLPFVKRAVGL